MPHSYARLRRTVRTWARQTVRDSIEVVLVKPVTLPGDDIDPDDFRPFHGFRVHEVPELDTVATGFVAGTRMAEAPIVMMAEDHAFPDPGLAAAILETYENDPDVVAVGPVLVNANPRTAASEASFVVSFSAVAYARATRESRLLAGHNTSYRRALLAQYGDDLVEKLKSERVLHYDIEAQGKKMVLLAHSQMRHYNFSRWSSVLAHSFLGGRLFAGKRSQDWGVGRRLVYGLGAPLIPIVRARRILKDLAESPEDRARLLPKRLLAIALPLAVHGFGELTGYLLGAGNAEVHYARFELHRRDQLTPRERREIDRFEP